MHESRLLFAKNATNRLRFPGGFINFASIKCFM